jgi:hypothetical protein
MKTVLFSDSLSVWSERVRGEMSRGRRARELRVMLLFQSLVRVGSERVTGTVHSRIIDLLVLTADPREMVCRLGVRRCGDRLGVVGIVRPEIDGIRRRRRGASASRTRWSIMVRACRSKTIHTASTHGRV